MPRDDSDEEQRRRRFSRRALIVGAGQVGALGLLAGRFHYLQITEGESYARLAEANRTRVLAVPAARGRILDRAGQVLADNDEAIRVVVTPSLAGNLSAVLRTLSRLVSIGEDEQAQLIARAHRQPPNVPLIVLPEIGFEEAARINLLAARLPGIETETWSRRRYRGGVPVNHLVGYVGAPERIAMDDDPVLRHPDARVGRTGVERGREADLRGVSGRVRREVDARGRIVRSVEMQRPVRGRDIALTIDLGLQRLVTKRMERERRAALVGIDCSTGGIVAMVSVPGFEISDIGRPVRSSAWSRIFGSGDDPLVNRTVSGLYPPGSTFKIVTALAALDGGVLKPEERLPCTGSLELGGHTFNCWKRSGHGSSDLVRAIAESCDCYFYEAARRLGIERLALAARALGLGRTFDCGLPLQKAGIVPNADWKHGRLGRPWLQGETLLAGIGQGYVLANPLQLAIMTARAATGLMVEPTIVRPADTDGRPEPEPIPFDAGSVEVVRRGLLAAVNGDGGTGSAARLDRSDGQLAGKTGTSQVKRFSAATKWSERDHSLFVGYAPASRPRFAVAAVVEHAGSGGSVAAPLVRDVMSLLLGVSPGGNALQPPSR